MSSSSSFSIWLTANNTTLQEEFIVSIGEREPKVLQKGRELQSMVKWTQNSTPHPFTKEQPSHRIHVKFKIISKYLGT
jgi:hypothetical protein